MLSWEHRSGAHLLLLALEPLGGMPLSLWCMAITLLYLFTYGHLPIIRASPPFDRYQVILLGRGILQVSPSWQDDLCCQCLVGVQYGCWQAASRGINPPSCPRWSLPSRRTKLATVGCQCGRCSLCTNSGESTSCTARTVTSPYLPQIWTTQQKAQLHS